MYSIWLGPQKTTTVLTFCKKLALALIKNDFLAMKVKNTRTRRCKRDEFHHDLVMAPPHAKKYMRTRWDMTVKAMYQQYICRGLGCKKQVWPYCICDPVVWLCKQCHTNHIVNEVIMDKVEDWYQCLIIFATGGIFEVTIEDDFLSFWAQNCCKLIFKDIINILQWKNMLYRLLFL